MTNLNGALKREREQSSLTQCLESGQIRWERDIHPRGRRELTERSECGRHQRVRVNDVAGLRLARRIDNRPMT